MLSETIGEPLFEVLRVGGVRTYRFSLERVLGFDPEDRADRPKVEEYKIEFEVYTGEREHNGGITADTGWIRRWPAAE